MMPAESCGFPRVVMEVAILDDDARGFASITGRASDRYISSGSNVPRGATATSVELSARLGGKPARYKWPHSFALWPVLPKSAYGKVTKRDVKRLPQEGV